MAIIVKAQVTCDFSGCQAKVEAEAEVRESRVMTGAGSEVYLSNLHVLKNDSLAGWKVDQGGHDKCRCPIHNRKPIEVTAEVDTSLW